MATPQWIKKLGGHAGELFVCAELSKRAIPNALLPENFADDDILVGNKAATQIGFVQVKACHPDRSKSFILRETQEAWRSAADNQFCALVWLGRTNTYEAPRYWLALKREVGELCLAHAAHGTSNWERRFFPPDAVAPSGSGTKQRMFLPSAWENRWSLFDKFRPT